MLRIVLPDHKPLAWYLAAEEYFAAKQVECWLFWIPPATVICGRHQNIPAEVNLPFCREHGIAVVRRKSGGGTVYADRGNLMISYISPSGHAEIVYAEYMQRIADALYLALSSVEDGEVNNVVTTQHNDILIDGRKVSGTACYTMPSATIVHGTLLCTVDLDALEQAITPSEEKLAKHAVKSVRQRVRNLGFMPDMASLLTTESREMTATEIEETDRLFQRDYVCAGV